MPDTRVRDLIGCALVGILAGVVLYASGVVLEVWPG